MLYKQNLHTHTVYCDGKNTPEEMIEKAISLGFHSIGFSGHAAMPFYKSWVMTEENTQKYIKEIMRVKEKYKGRIDVILGTELDNFSNVDLSPYEYAICSCHHVKKNGEYLQVDGTKESVNELIARVYGGNGILFAKDYYESIKKIPSANKNGIVGHFDLVTKHREMANFFDSESDEYKSYALDALRCLSERFDVFEMNTGAISRKYRKDPYLDLFILKELKRLNKKIVITSDCHDANFLDCYFDECEKILKSVGFEEIYSLIDGEFIPQKI